ncbi:MAG: hypothetical protein PHC63_07100 [Candidatus Bathyarchaeota archaeon]|nr:hypothetical protein [Candidatus Bathyarchaeota archaeon]MDI9577897.1 hypothetical protein [Thermoproteota archaeon]
MRIYLTHCSAKKDEKLKNSKIEVTPDKLYTSSRLLGFINKCKEDSCKWAIFSDLYGIWFPTEKHPWYEKHPKKVTEKEFQQLLSAFDEKLSVYDEIFFYYNPGRFHTLYKKLLEESRLTKKIIKFSHKSEII